MSNKFKKKDNPCSVCKKHFVNKDSFPNFLFESYGPELKIACSLSSCHGPMHFVCLGCLDNLHKRIVPGSILIVPKPKGMSHPSAYEILEPKAGFNTRNYSAIMHVNDLCIVLATKFTGDNSYFRSTFSKDFKDDCTIMLLVLTGEFVGTIFLEKLYRLHKSYEVII
jgi:hypothetical protein